MRRSYLEQMEIMSTVTCNVMTGTSISSMSCVYGYAYTCTVNAMQCNVKICYVMACMFCMHVFFYLLNVCMYIFIYMYRGMFMYGEI